MPDQPTLRSCDLRAMTQVRYSAKYLQALARPVSSSPKPALAGLVVRLIHVSTCTCPQVCVSVKALCTCNVMYKIVDRQTYMESASQLPVLL